MKLKFFKPPPKKKVTKPISRTTLIKKAFAEACIELCLEGNYSSVTSARNAMLSKAKIKLQTTKAPNS